MPQTTAVASFHNRLYVASFERAVDGAKTRYCLEYPINSATTFSLDQLDPSVARKALLPSTVKAFRGVDIQEKGAKIRFLDNHGKVKSVQME